jgi:hypothetical protein
MPKWRVTALASNAKPNSVVIEIPTVDPMDGERQVVQKVAANLRCRRWATK